jgi:predicted transcriptional regulator
MAGQRGKRSRLDIISEILSEALGGIGKTRLMYRANLSFKRREKYVGELIDLGLIEIRSGSFTVYITTQRGQEWLKNYKKIKL